MGRKKLDIYLDATSPRRESDEIIMMLGGIIMILKNFLYMFRILDWGNLWLLLFYPFVWIVLLIIVLITLSINLLAGFIKSIDLLAGFIKYLIDLFMNLLQRPNT